MNEALENAWNEFERTGEIANSADELLGYATRLTEENAKLREFIEKQIPFLNSVSAQKAQQLLNQLKDQGK